MQKTIDSVFFFGQYRGRTIREVYQGTLELSEDLKEGILREFEAGKWNSDDASSGEKRFLPSAQDIVGMRTKGLLHDAQKLDFGFKLAPELRGNPEYVEWAIKNIKDFFLSPDDVKRLQDLDVCCVNFVEVEPAQGANGKRSIAVDKATRKHVLSPATLSMNTEKYKKSIEDASE